MARFVFQLDGVLRQRKDIEQRRQRELARIDSQMSQLQIELRQLNLDVQTATVEMRQQHLVGRLDLSFLAAHRRFMQAMQRKAMTLVQRMSLVQKQVDQARAALLEAAKARKAVEKLRERQYERWLADVNRREAAEMDEIGMQLTYRQMLGEADPI